MGVSKAHLDSPYLLSLIKDEPGAREVKRMLYRLRSNAFEVFVPHTVLGEICGVIYRDFESDRDRRDKMAALADAMGSNKIPWENAKPTNKDALDTVAALGKDEWLDTTDAPILSQVLTDPDSKFFFTTDRIMLRNAAVVDLERALRGAGKRRAALEILEDL